jgi:glycosyltransferase involved in cell wall biosynthesis
MPDGKAWPRISVVTPSFRQGAFLEETIRSVLLSGYPDLEYIVIDGGSDDGSVEIIRRYATWLSYWISEKDSGQSEAINKGFARVTGLLVAYLNSDDSHLPNALGRIARTWNRDPGVAMVTGGYLTIDEHSEAYDLKLPSLPGSGPLDLTLVDHLTWLLPQPSSFYSRSHLEQVGMWVREDLQYTMDREIIYRLCRSGRTRLLNEPVATYRIHKSSKTVADQSRVAAEARRSFGYCTWGGERERAVRERVCKWRIAQGYRGAGARRACTVRDLGHLLRSAYYRPAYLGDWKFLRMVSATVGRIVLKGLRLYDPARALRDGLRNKIVPRLSGA